MEPLNESEADKTNRVLRCVQAPQWDFLQSLTSLPGNAFMDAYKTPVVTEITPPKPPLPPNYDQPNSDALAA